jgi:hypothetical protein
LSTAKKEPCRGLLVVIAIVSCRIAGCLAALKIHGCGRPISRATRIRRTWNVSCIYAVLVGKRGVSEMISTRMFVFAALVAFWILGLTSELDSARATTAYLLISLVLLISTAAFKTLRPAAE